MINKKMDEIVEMTTGFVYPYILLFGLYLIIHSHLTPGGGFVAGVIIASALIMLILARGKGFIQNKLSGKASFIEYSGGIIILLLGIYALIQKEPFLSNVLPKGNPGQLFSAFNLALLQLAVALHVIGGLVNIILEYWSGGENRDLAD